MDNRPPLGSSTSRPVPPQRALTGALNTPAVPSRFNPVRSLSQPGSNLVDLTDDPASAHDRNSAAFHMNRSNLPTPEIIHLSDDDTERPAKRAKIGNHGHSISACVSDTVLDAAHYKLPGSPLPALSIRPSEKHVRSHRPVVDRLARKANGLEPPAVATRLPPPKHVADFAPWNGQHPEDVLTETVVKGGYYDKPPGPNSTESNSAKPSIWPNLSAKNNMGLQTLSYLFTSILEKRQVMGKCTAPPTFKPPPRVTVTDTKREAWLRDLANPDVPLRKQSRTIPHGIRGKLLMEQCLTKDIPMPRAVWLAKCVGANELRAFRRKGVSGAAAAQGESKWIREWTVHVEQFLEGVIASCGQPDWQSKMDYAAKLATSFYSERLLERDHYLDWIVSSYALSAMDRLPIWIILVQLYFKDITAFGKRGRQLAEATLENLHQITTDNTRAYDALKVRLQKLIMIMAVANRGCLVIPHTWQKYRHLLAPNSIAPDTPAQNISRRNDRLAAPLLKTPQNITCPLLRLYSLLDRQGPRLDMTALSTQCQAIVPDHQTLIHALLDWSASVYRTGMHRVYLSARIIASLHAQGQHTDGAIQEYMQKPGSPSILVEKVHLVIAELTRLDCFSPGRYMQWLMTSGVLSSGGASALSTGLLAALPMDAMPRHLLNTRDAILRRLGFQEDHKAAVDAVEAAIDASTLVDGSLDVFSQFDLLTTSAKIQLVSRLVLKVAKGVKQGNMTIAHFGLIRDVIERAHQSQALAQVVRSAMLTDDTALLATISDTIHMHVLTFEAMGCLTPMLDRIIERYRYLRSQQSLDRTFVVALMALARQFDDRSPIVRLLENDLTICEQQTSMAVCSPASDNLVSMQATNLDSDSDIDAVFASGNTMDEQLMQRVFSRIVVRAGKSNVETAQPSMKLSAWLNQLRAVDATNFENLAKSYVLDCLRSGGDNTSPLRVISAMIATGCARLDTVLDLAREVNTPAAACSAIRLLSTHTITNECLSEAEMYRYRVIQKRHRADFPDKIIPLFLLGMDDAKFPIAEGGIFSTILDFTVRNHALCLAALSTAPQSSTFFTHCGRLVMKMLALGRGIELKDVRLDAKAIIALAEPLSAVQCTGALAFLAKLESYRGTSGESTLQSAVLDAIKAGSEVWPQLLEGAGPDSIRGIYRWAKEQVLDHALRYGGHDVLDQDEVSRNLDILSVAYHSASKEDSYSILASLTEKVKAIHEQFFAHPVEMRDHLHNVLFSIRVLLHLSILYSPTPPPTNSDMMDRNRLQLVGAWCILLGNPYLQRHQDLCEYICDVLSLLADPLTEDGLSCLRFSLAKKGYTDPRTTAVLGVNHSPDTWLALVSHPNVQGQGARAMLQKQAAAGGQQRQQAAAVAMQQQQQQQQNQNLAARNPVKGPMGMNAATPGFAPTSEVKVVPYPLRRWEIMSNATPTVGDNDTSLSLTLFGARKV